MIECYSYTDAKRRKPEAWREVVISGECPDGRRWERVEHERIAPPGLGELVYDATLWIYICPDGLAMPLWEYDPAKRPPLPQPKNKWRRCGCHERQHTCGACGQPYWVEIHGMADGYCTYCYYRG